MIDDDIGLRITTKRVIAAPELPPAEAHIANDDIVGIDLGGLALDADTIAGCGLPRNSDKGFIDLKTRLKLDDPSDPKNHRAWPTCQKCFAHASRPRVRQGRHLQNAPTTPTGCPRPGPFCPRKRQGGLWWGLCGAREGKGGEEKE